MEAFDKVVDEFSEQVDGAVTGGVSLVKQAVSYAEAVSGVVIVGLGSAALADAVSWSYAGMAGFAMVLARVANKLLGGG